MMMIGTLQNSTVRSHPYNVTQLCGGKSHIPVRPHLEHRLINTSVSSKRSTSKPKQKKRTLNKKTKGQDNNITAYKLHGGLTIPPEGSPANQSCNDPEPKLTNTIVSLDDLSRTVFSRTFSIVLRPSCDIPACSRPLSVCFQLFPSVPSPSVVI